MGVEFKLSEGMHKRHLTWRGERELRCSRCGKKISPGDWIHRSGASCFVQQKSRGGKSPGLTKFYHLSCFEGMFVSA